MLGDDDALLRRLPGAMDELISLRAPEVIYTKALVFTYPGVDPARPERLSEDHGCGEFFAGAESRSCSTRERAVDVVRAAMRLPPALRLQRAVRADRRGA